MSNCDKCALNASRLHPDLPFGCFNSWCDGDGYVKGDPMKNYYVKDWIKKHSNWKGTPHLKYWFYCTDQKEFDDFIKAYPKENMPNESWASMYEEITLK